MIIISERRLQIMGLNLLKALMSRHVVMMLMLTGLLTASISSNNYVSNIAWAETKYSNDAEPNLISTTSGFSSDNDICDFDSEIFHPMFYLRN